MGCFQGRGTASWWKVVAMVVVVVSSVWGAPGVRAANYKVGDPAGWTLRSSYDSWLTGKTFQVGDILEFQYESSHNVVEVTKAEYDGCSPGSNTPKTDGDTKYTLTAAGSFYYICSVSTHCEQGMKIAVTVEAASTTPSTNGTTPTSTPATTPSTNTTTPSTNTTSPSTPNSSPLPISFPIFSLLLTFGLSILFIKS